MTVPQTASSQQPIDPLKPVLYLDPNLGWIFFNPGTLQLNANPTGYVCWTTTTYNFLVPTPLGFSNYLFQTHHFQEQYPLRRDLLQ